MANECRATQRTNERPADRDASHPSTLLMCARCVLRCTCITMDVSVSGLYPLTSGTKTRAHHSLACTSLLLPYVLLSHILLPHTLCFHMGWASLSPPAVLGACVPTSEAWPSGLDTYVALSLSALPRYIVCLDTWRQPSTPYSVQHRPTWQQN